MKDPTPEELANVLRDMVPRVVAAMPEAANVVVLYNLFDLPDARLGKMLRERITNAALDPAGEVERAERVKAKLESDDAELLDSLKIGDAHMGATLRSAALAAMKMLRELTRKGGA